MCSRMGFWKVIIFIFHRYPRNCRAIYFEISHVGPTVGRSGAHGSYMACQNSPHTFRPWVRMVWCIPLSIRCRGLVFCVKQVVVSNGFYIHPYNQSPLSLSIACFGRFKVENLWLGGGNSNVCLFSPRKLGKIFTHFEGYIFLSNGLGNNHQLEIMDKSRFASTLKINWFFRLERFDIHIKLVVLDFLACIWIYPIGGYHLACTRWFVFC